MRLLLATGFVFLFFATTSAQQHHYIYIQTENKQPFYTSIKDKVYSSSSSGYLIISKLPDGIHHLTIGFPKNEWPQQKFTITLTNKDAGFVLKNLDAKGWGLFNIQTMDMLMASDKATVSDTPTTNKNDAFSNVLADVVNTPSIKEKDEIKKTDLKGTNMNASVERILSLLDDAGRSMVYVVHDGIKTDTVRVLISYKQDKPIADSVNKSKIALKKANDPAKNHIVVNNAVSKTHLTIAGCAVDATQDDFIKLRKEMAAEDAEDGMIAVAKKAFRLKCYSTEQVKNLSVLFLKDESRYSFFDTAYPFVNDTANFIQLEKLLSDPYYIGRFKAMIRP